MTLTEGANKMKKTKRTKPIKNETGKTAKAIISNGAQSVKVSVHNSFIALVFGLVMFLVCVCAIEAAYAITGIVIGQATAGSFETVADIVVMVITIIMVCGFDLFFAIKINNLIIKAMAKRFWHIDKISGDIIKNDTKDATISIEKNNDNK